MIGNTILHYKILEKLGEGGMGVVYKAEDTRLNRFAALKFLPNLGADEEEKKRFIQEARAASSIEHNNICTVYEIGETKEGNVFIALAYYEGITLKKKIQKGAQKIPEAFDIILQTAEGLAKAHEQGITHRDIKPANIMITNDGVVKILDFGLAKLHGQSGLTTVGTTLGTTAYMSPEQASGASVDVRTDIWSLGAVFYEMLTGEIPFKAEHDSAVIYMIINEELMPPSSLDLKIPHMLDTFIAKLMAKEPAKRYQNMGELIKNLKITKEELETTEKATKIKSIAVLPFDNISPDKENDYFGEGLTGELIANLSRLKDFKVISRTTSMQYKDTKKDIKTIGRELSARYIIEGNVRKFGDDLRITAQLIDVDSDTQLWAETYKGKLADVFDIQEKVSKQIVDALMVKLTPTEKIELTKRPTVNAEAFDYNLRARNYLYRYSKNYIQFAIQFFEKAISLDSRYAEAYAGLGEAYAVKYAYFERKEIWLEQAMELSLKAIMYDPSLSEAYAALSLVYFYKASYDEALTAVQKALNLDPNNFFGYWILARIYHTTGRDQEAIEPLKNVLKLNPNFYVAYSDMRMVYESMNDTEKFNEINTEGVKFFPKYLENNPDDSRARILYANFLLITGDVEKAKSEVTTALTLNPNDNVMMYNAACVYARINEKKLAIDTLKTIILAGYEDFDWMRKDPDFENIKNNPEFLELIEGK
jgi:serine/threonine protein kinase/Flp pilus assembly protein TadD